MVAICTEFRQFGKRSIVRNVESLTTEMEIYCVFLCLYQIYFLTATEGNFFYCDGEAVIEINQ